MTAQDAKTLSYKDAGVDVEKGDAFVDSIKEKVKKTYGDRVINGVGGFACLYEIADDKLLAAGTDGVGTKLKMAQMLNKHDTIGVDLVAMCVNDVLCTGAMPLFFMDYLATGKLDLAVSQDIVSGVVDGCLQSQSALIGGETAEMPGMYANGEYDLAGFVVGEVLKKDLIDGSTVKSGDSLIGLPSSGFHSNGYSLLRRIVPENDTTLLQKCLEPTKIYHSIVKNLLKQDKGLIKAMAHITGGGLRNVARVNDGFDYVLTNMPEKGNRAEVFDDVLALLGDTDMFEMYRTFNMGIGFVLVTDAPDKVAEMLTEMNEPFFHIGHVQDKSTDTVQVIMDMPNMEGAL